MPLALEYGMTLYDFWYEDHRLFRCYQKAYHRRTDREAWLQGIYTHQAVNAAIHNVMPGAIGTAFSKHSRHKPLHYPNTPLHEQSQARPTVNPQTEVAGWHKRIKQLKGMG